jgi:hypothetical protein
MPKPHLRNVQVYMDVLPSLLYCDLHTRLVQCRLCCVTNPNSCRFVCINLPGMPAAATHQPADLPGLMQRALQARP